MPTLLPASGPKGSNVEWRLIGENQTGMGQAELCEPQPSHTHPPEEGFRAPSL